MHSALLVLTDYALALGVRTPAGCHHTYGPAARQGPGALGHNGPSDAGRAAVGAREPAHDPRLGLVAQTVETVRFTRPERVDFRLVRTARVERRGTSAPKPRPAAPATG